MAKTMKYPMPRTLPATMCLVPNNTFHRFTGAFEQADSYCGSYPIANHMLVINDKIVFTAMDPAYQETANYFNMLKKENLLDIDSFTPGPRTGDSFFTRVD
jgi:hypothetical protein